MQQIFGFCTKFLIFICKEITSTDLPLLQGLMGTFNSFNSTRVRFSPTRKGALSNVDHNRLSLRCDSQNNL